MYLFRYMEDQGSSVILNLQIGATLIKLQRLELECLFMVRHDILYLDYYKLIDLFCDFFTPVHVCLIELFDI